MRTTRWGITLTDCWWLFHVPVLVQSGVSRACVGAFVTDCFTCLCWCSRQWLFHVPVFVQASLTVSRACAGTVVTDCFTCLCWCSHQWLFHVHVLVQSSLIVSRACVGAGVTDCFSHVSVLVQASLIVSRACVGAGVTDCFTCLCWCRRHWLFHVPVLVQASLTVSRVCVWVMPLRRRPEKSQGSPGDGRARLSLPETMQPRPACDCGAREVVVEFHLSTPLHSQPLPHPTNSRKDQHVPPLLPNPCSPHPLPFRFPPPPPPPPASVPNPITPPPPPPPPLVLSSLLSRLSLWKLTDAQSVRGRLVLANALVVSFAIWEMFTISQTACLY